MADGATLGSERIGNQMDHQKLSHSITKYSAKKPSPRKSEDAFISVVATLLELIERQRSKTGFLSYPATRRHMADLVRRNGCSPSKGRLILNIKRTVDDFMRLLEEVIQHTAYYNLRVI